MKELCRIRGWNPMYYDGALELQHLFHRDYAPLEERTVSAIKRMRTIPRSLAVARQNLSKTLDRTILRKQLSLSLPDA